DRQDGVVEVVVHVVADRLMPGVALPDQEVTTWPSLQHEGEVFRAELRRRVAHDSIARHDVSRGLLDEARMFGTVYRRGKQCLVFDFGARAVCLCLALGDLPDRALEFPAHRLAEAAHGAG